MFLLIFIGAHSARVIADKYDEEDKLYEVTLPIFSHSICNDIYENTLTQRMICAGYQNGSEGKDICDGDSGGPLICLGDKLFGIASFSRESGRCGHNPSIFGRVASIRRWISNVTGIFP